MVSRTDEARRRSRFMRAMYHRHILQRCRLAVPSGDDAPSSWDSSQDNLRALDPIAVELQLSEGGQGACADHSIRMLPLSLFGCRMLKQPARGLW